MSRMLCHTKRMSQEREASVRSKGDIYPTCRLSCVKVVRESQHLRCEASRLLKEEPGFLEGRKGEYYKRTILPLKRGTETCLL